MGLLSSLERYFIYAPRKSLITTPAEHGFEFESVKFRADDGTLLHGWFVPKPNARATVLLCHGNAGNVSYQIDQIRLFQNLQMSVFTFDYRGYGQSEGKPCEDGLYRDGKAAWQVLTETKGLLPERIVIFGHSLGGSVAAWLGKEVKAGALILQATFTTMRQIAKCIYPYFPLRKIMRSRYDNLSNIAQANAPVLIVHSTDDEIIPFEHGKRLFEAAKEPKEFLQVCYGHDEAMRSPNYFAGLKAFLDKYLPPVPQVESKNTAPA
jgi:fermentation-respiration switch protein FrsA (DUF1100 family)